MFDEEPKPRRRDALEPAKFDGWSVGDLRAYIEALRSEIARAEEAIGAREASRTAADAFFRKT